MSTAIASHINLAIATIYAKLTPQRSRSLDAAAILEQAKEGVPG